MSGRTCAWGGCDATPAAGGRYCPQHARAVAAPPVDLFSGLHDAPQDPAPGGAGERMRHPLPPYHGGPLHNPGPPPSVQRLEDVPTLPAVPDVPRHGHGIPGPEQSLPYVAGNANSADAAARAKVLAAPQRRRVYDHLLAKGTAGSTRRLMEDALGMSGSSLHPRVLELLTSGHLVEGTDRIGGSAVVRADIHAAQCPACNAGNPDRGRALCARCSRKGATT